MKGGIAIEDDARNWLAGMHEHGYQDVRIEPMSDGRVTFPVSEEDADAGDIAATFESVAAARCPHCHRLVTFPGFDAIFAFVCPECAQPVKVATAIQ
jgi:hypothetical protein